MRLVNLPEVEKFVRIYCVSCELSTPWILLCNNDETAALNECGQLWNRRTDRVPIECGTVEDLIQKEINADDISLLLGTLAKTTDQWETRGPILSQIAQRLIDASLISPEWWPLTPTLEDAGRYRKLVGMSRSTTDNATHVERVVFPPIEINEEHRSDAYEHRLAAAIDALPDRERW